ncbi:MAG: DEAD/DEAH box helicase [Clostridia bacterium]|nr:DEAD/DEAH box helicase [Clostridia bacterium]
MTEADRVFDRFPDFIKNYIYSHNWETLRAVQIAAAQTLFETDHNLLLTSSTASGKTEAAFFPILTDLMERPPLSVGVLYVAPLKSLINDQFERMDDLLRESGVKVTHWHGDVAQSHKKKLMDHPTGILQITPESLEAMLIHRSNDLVRLFGDLRYIVLDEIHILTGTDRGNQIICQLNRLDAKLGFSPRRIGLSATIGDPQTAANWLGAGSPRPVDVPQYEAQKIHWRLGLEHFYIQNTHADQTQQAREDPGNHPSPNYAMDAGYEYMYECVKDRKALVFSNTREETEYLTATFRQIAAMRNEPDVFLIHHGNLSAALREHAETVMKQEDVHAVTCATVTMELGIDIGRLERVLQSESPNSVSSFLQRLGRSGRRGQPPEMMMVFREENPLPDTPLPQLIPWNLIRAIAEIQLYIEERFIEPPSFRKMPWSLCFQQTLSILASSGELSAPVLAKKVLGLPPFASIAKEDYRQLILSMLEKEYLEWTEEKTLIIGLKGEKILNSFKFYAVFKDSEDFTVRCGSDEIGTITTPPPVGDRFALAGKVWEVEELDLPRKLIYVKAVEGKMQVSWPGDYGEIHTRILERMLQVLQEDTVYPYLKENARHRLDVARHVARNTGMDQQMLVHLGGYSWCLFPWLGTRSFRTFRKLIARESDSLGISNLEFDGCNYMIFRMEKGDAASFVLRMKEILTQGVDLLSLVGKKEIPLFDKYDPYIPGDLLRRAYATDRLRIDEVEKRVEEMYRHMPAEE